MRDILPRLLAAVFLVGALADARGQTSPDALFVSEWTCCLGDLYACAQDYPLQSRMFEGSWADQYEHTEPQGLSTGYRLLTANLDVTGNTATLRCNSLVRQMVRSLLMGGISHGGGQTATIKIYVRGEPGTIYSLTTGTTGQVQIVGGTGATTAELDGVIISGGDPPRTVDRARATTIGRTTAERHPTHPEYTLAATCGSNFYGRSTYFAGNFDVDEVGDLRLDVEVHRGGCDGGTITIQECAPPGLGTACGSPYYRAGGYTEEVHFRGNCACCEYRRRVYATNTVFFGVPFDTSSEIEDCGHWDCGSQSTHCHGHRGEPRVDGGQVANCDPRFNAFEPDAQNGCEYRGSDFPGSRPFGLLARPFLIGFRRTWHFTGQVVEISACSGGPERVLDEHHWDMTLAFDATGAPIGSSDGPASGQVSPPTPTTRAVGGNSYTFTLARFGGRIGLAATTAGDVGESPTFEMSIQGMPMVPVLGGGTISVQDSQSGETFVGAAFDSAGSMPSTLRVTFSANGATDSFDIPLSHAAVFCIADRNGDAGVTIDDLLEWLSLYEEGNLAADVDLDGGVTIEDLLEYLAAYSWGC